MKSTINCFIPYAGAVQAERTVQGLQATGLVKKSTFLSPHPASIHYQDANYFM